jgi:hypothetical protein
MKPVSKYQLRVPVAIFLMGASISSNSGPLLHGLEASAKVERKVVIAAARKGRLAAVATLLVTVNLGEIKSTPVGPEIIEQRDKGHLKYTTLVCVTASGRVAVPVYFKYCPNGESPTTGPQIDISKV